MAPIQVLANNRKFRTPHKLTIESFSVIALARSDVPICCGLYVNFTKSYLITLNHNLLELTFLHGVNRAVISLQTPSELSNLSSRIFWLYSYAGSTTSMSYVLVTTMGYPYLLYTVDLRVPGTLQ